MLVTVPWKTFTPLTTLILSLLKMISRILFEVLLYSPLLIKSYSFVMESIFILLLEIRTFAVATLAKDKNTLS